MDIWKENILENLKGGILEYEIAGKLLADIKKEFREGNKEIVKMVELKRLEQRGRMMEEFVQEFRKAVKRSGYKRRLLVKKLKKSMNRIIH